MTQRKIKRALISVSDKTSLEQFARSLAAMGVELLSTGGTAKALRGFGLAVKDVADETGFPEIMDGRVKPCTPRSTAVCCRFVITQIMKRNGAAHAIGLIDLLVVNLYPFEETLARGESREEIIENIDVGGPAMIRAAAKNHDSVAVIVTPEDYDAVLAEMQSNKGSTTRALRRRLAATAFARTASYDAQFPNGWRKTWAVLHRRWWTQAAGFALWRKPAPVAAVYKSANGRTGILDATQVQGKELSYNNINDADAALEAVAEFGEELAACVIVKHANPCGVAVAPTSAEAYQRRSCVIPSAPSAASSLSTETGWRSGREIAKIFTEVILAPGADDDALRILSAKKNLRLLLLPRMPVATASAHMVKSIAGGCLVQSRDAQT